MGLTLDTGALIALERRSPRAAKLLAAAHRNGRPITVPSVVIAQWWRGQRGPAWRQLVASVEIERLGVELARIAGEALAATGTTDIVDAVVVASAAQRGDAVLTGDVGDLQRIADAAFPSVRILGLG